MRVLADSIRNSLRPGTPVQGENRKSSPLGKQKLVPLLQRSVDQTQPRVWIATVGDGRYGKQQATPDSGALSPAVPNSYSGALSPSPVASLWHLHANDREGRRTLKLLGDCLVHKKELEHRRYRLGKCCCGECFVQIDFENLALVFISVISTRGIVLWSTNWGSDARVRSILYYAG